MHPLPITLGYLAPVPTTLKTCFTFNQASGIYTVAYNMFRTCLEDGNSLHRLCNWTSGCITGCPDLIVQPDALKASYLDVQPSV